MPVSEPEYWERQLKLVLVGEPSCGKSAIVTRHCHNEFNRQYYPTIGVDFILKRSLLQGDKHVRLIIWDVSGQSLQSTLLDKYIYGANIILLVFDITNAASFNRLNDWLSAIRKMQLEKAPVIALVGNKCDMEHQRAVSSEKQIRFANDCGFTSHNISARTGENVSVTFQKLCAEYLGLKLTKLEQEANQNVVIAEIIAPRQPVQIVSSSNSSSICSIQ